MGTNNKTVTYLSYWHLFRFLLKRMMSLYNTMQNKD